MEVNNFGRILLHSRSSFSIYGILLKAVCLKNIQCSGLYNIFHKTIDFEIQNRFKKTKQNFFSRSCVLVYIHQSKDFIVTNWTKFGIFFACKYEVFLSKYIQEMNENVFYSNFSLMQTRGQGKHFSRVQQDYIPSINDTSFKSVYLRNLGISCYDPNLEIQIRSRSNTLVECTFYQYHSI